jgi:hypothetical protein
MASPVYERVDREDGKVQLVCTITKRCGWPTRPWAESLDAQSELYAHKWNRHPVETVDE